MGNAPVFGTSNLPGAPLERIPTRTGIRGSNTPNISDSNV